MNVFIGLMLEQIKLNFICTDKWHTYNWPFKH